MLSGIRKWGRGSRSLRGREAQRPSLFTIENQVVWTVLGTWASHGPSASFCTKLSWQSDIEVGPALRRKSCLAGTVKIWLLCLFFLWSCVWDVPSSDSLFKVNLKARDIQEGVAKGCRCAITLVFLGGGVRPNYWPGFTILSFPELMRSDYLGLARSSSLEFPHSRADSLLFSSFRCLLSRKH